MNRDELEGVIAHEVAHIRNGDILVMTVAVATVGAIAMISDIFFRMLYWGALTGGGASHRRRFVMRARWAATSRTAHRSATRCPR